MNFNSPPALSNSDGPTNIPGNGQSTWQIQPSSGQNRTGIWLPVPLDNDRRRHEIANRERYNAYLNASPGPSFTPQGFVEHSGLNGRTEASSNVSFVGSGRPAQIAYFAGQQTAPSA
jgi:hypothetical protein